MRAIGAPCSSASLRACRPSRPDAARLHFQDERAASWADSAVASVQESVTTTTNVPSPLRRWLLVASIAARTHSAIASCSLWAGMTTPIMSASSELGLARFQRKNKAIRMITGMGTPRNQSKRERISFSWNVGRSGQRSRRRPP